MACFGDGLQVISNTLSVSERPMRLGLSSQTTAAALTTPTTLNSAVTGTIHNSSATLTATGFAILTTRLAVSGDYLLSESNGYATSTLLVTGGGTNISPANTYYAYGGHVSHTTGSGATMLRTFTDQNLLTFDINPSGTLSVSLIAGSQMTLGAGTGLHSGFSQIVFFFTTI